MGNAMIGASLTDAILKGKVEKVNNFIAKWAADNDGRPPEKIRIPGGGSGDGCAAGCSAPLACLPPSSSFLETGTLRGFNLNAPLPKGFTPLQLAARTGQAEVVRLLLNVQVDINGMDQGLRTPLHYAARHGQTRIVANLLAELADPCIMSKEGSTTPLDLARKFNHAACVRVLEDNLKLWQGWVDHSTPGLLGHSYSPVWLVICQNSRPNTGPNCSNARVTCASCGCQVSVPPYVSSFQCSNCRAPLNVSASVQLALYRVSSLQRNMVLPNTATPFEVRTLPDHPSQIEVKTVDESKSLGEALFGAISNLVLNTMHSNRRKGISLKISRKGVLYGTEYRFRVGTEEERTALVRVLRDPLLAAYSASAAPPPPSAPAAVAAIAPSAPPPITASAPTDKTAGNYSLEKKPNIVNPILLPSSAAATSAVANASAPPPENIDEAGQCIICMERHADSAVVPCGHMCGCYTCLEAVRTSGASTSFCPICRGPVVSVIRIFRS